MNPMENLFKFLAHLDSIEASYILNSDSEAVIVLIRTDAGVHEVSFFADGAIEIQNFTAEAEVETPTLPELIESFTG